MKIVIAFLILILGYLLHRLFLWLEKNGHMFYLNRKPDIGIVGGALEELNGFLNPGVRHTIEMKRTEAKIEQNVERG